MQPASLGPNIKPGQTALASVTTYSQIKQSQTPFYNNSMQLDENVGTTPSDSYPITNEVGDAKSLVDRSETSATLPSSDISSIPNGNGFSAGYVSIGQRAQGQLIIQKVPLVSQQDYTSCGEAAFAMGWNFLHPDLALDIGMVEKTGLTLEVYFPARLPRPRGYLGTSPSGMETIGNYYAAEYKLLPPTVGSINLNNGEAYARLEAKGLLYSQLSAGNPVIIEVTDIIGNPSKIYNDSHYVTVTGMNFDNGIVIYNDPLINLSMSGKYLGYGRLAEWNDVWASWSDNNDINPGEGGHPGRGWYMIVH